MPKVTLFVRDKEGLDIKQYTYNLSGLDCLGKGWSIPSLFIIILFLHKNEIEE